MIAVYKEHMHQHPLLKRIKDIRTTEIGALHSETPLTRFQNTSLYNEFYKLVDTTDQLWISAVCADEMLVVCYSREHIFTKAEQAFMLMMKPHIEIAWRNWKRLRRLRARLTESPVATAPDVELMPPAGPPDMNVLTRRQRQVAELVAAGLTNPQIAHSLGCSPRTVGKHLENIYEALDLHHRAALAAHWRERGLLALAT
ncbi:MAG: helix-turn-helix transcriptional regulator [Lentisphaerae bacterium]|nr:helix-turn-helix transcriptional regulator [Lentisphaerota bacterium]